MIFKRGQEPKEAMNIGIKGQLDAFLKEEYPKLSYRDPNQMLRICADHGKLDFVKYLIEKENADPHNNDEHCVRWAAHSGHLDVVKYFVEEHNADISVNNFIAYRWAQEKNHEDIANYLQKIMKTKETKLPATGIYVRESLFEFTRGQDPKVAMGIGMVPKIKEWLEDHYIKKYRINNDFTIDTLEDVQLNYNTDLKEFPDYINFNIAHKDFSCRNSSFKSLRGFPKIVKADCEVQYNKLRSLKGAPEKVIGKFICSYNFLSSLEGAPKTAEEFHCEGNKQRFKVKDVINVCEVHRNIVVHTEQSASYYKQREEQAAKRKTTLPVAQRTNHNLGTRHFATFDYTDYTKGYKGYKVYEFIRDNGPVTAEQVGRFAHEMTYGKIHKERGKIVSYSKSAVVGHVMPYLTDNSSAYSNIVNDKVIKTKQGKFKADCEYIISPIGLAFLKKKEPIFGGGK